jgi:hypothetical protein
MTEPPSSVLIFLRAVRVDSSRAKNIESLWADIFVKSVRRMCELRRKTDESVYGWKRLLLATRGGYRRVS